MSEIEYADKLIDDYGNTMIDYETSVTFAIYDITNTIEAFSGLGLATKDRKIYYKTVLQILKDKL